MVEVECSHSTIPPNKYISKTSTQPLCLLYEKTMYKGPDHVPQVKLHNKIHEAKLEIEIL